jgi:RNA polymerase nonessential primary-like sigma factor
MNEDTLSSQEEEVEELASADDAGVDDYLGPDILSDVTQLYFNDIGQNELLSVEEEVRHARRVRQIQIEALASLRKILRRSGISRETLL